MLQLLSSTITASGEIIVAYTVIAVHHRFMKEHKVDNKLFKTMGKEQKVSFVGILLIAFGWILNVIDALII